MSFKPSGGSAGSISGSSDTALSNPADGQVLTYNASLQKWQNTAVTAPAPPQASATQLGTIKLAGDLSGGSAASPKVSAVNGVSVTGTPSSGQVLQATGASAATWATVTQSGTVSDATTGAKGVVQLAGDLAGTAAAPTLSATTNVNSIISNNSTVMGNSSAIAGKAAKGANADITSLSGLTTALSIAQGGTGATSAAAALTALGALAASQKAAASGVASLDANTLVPKAQLGSGTASSTTVLYGDGTWRAPAAQAVTTGFTWTATKTGAYTAANGDAIACDASGAGFTVTLPTTLGANAVVRVKKIDSTVNAVLVASSANIDGSASFSINNQYASQDFSYSGTTWYAV